MAKSIFHTSRYVTPDYTKTSEIPELGIEVFSYINPSNNKVFVKGFSGRRMKHDFFHMFNTASDALLFVTDWIENRQKTAENKKKRRADLAIIDTPAVLGDIYHYSWGWEQTQCEFFQVTAVKGKKVELTAIDGKTTKATSSMSCYMIPVKDSFLVSHSGRVEVMEKRMKGDGHGGVIFHMAYGHAYKHKEGEEHYCSWYA